MKKLNRRIQKESSRRGIVLVLAAFAMIIVMVFAAFTVDFGYVCSEKSHIQAATDAAALAAAMDFTQNQKIAETRVDTYLASNGFDPSDPGIVRTVEFGDWDPVLNAFTVSNFDAANAVRVHARASSVKSFFGTMLGRDSYTVEAESISLTGTAPRDVVMVIDCLTSMDAPMHNGLTRMENTRIAAQDLIDRLHPSHDRVGLAVYSWEDLSRDKYQKTGRMETALDFSFGPTETRIAKLNDGEYGSGTNIGGGFRAGLDVFLSDASPRTEPELVKIMIMLTDGRVNEAEPYPFPDDGPAGTLPSGPYSGGGYNDETAVTKWANTIKARGIKVYVVTLGDSSHAMLMSDAASDPDAWDDQYYYHVPHGPLDYQLLRDVYSHVGGNYGGPELVC